MVRTDLRILLDPAPLGVWSGIDFVAGSKQLICSLVHFRKVGNQLHVSAVLEGGVCKAGGKLRVTAQLINVSDGYHLWSKDYDGDVKEIFNFQSNVAESIAANTGHL